MITVSAKETPLRHLSSCDINQDATSTSSNTSSSKELHAEHESNQKQFPTHEENTSSYSSTKMKIEEQKEEGVKEEVKEDEEDNDTPLQLEGQLQLIEKLVQFTSTQSIPQSEQDAIQRRVQRERAAEQINARRAYSNAHRSLVESLCHTALERRRKAAQHIAQDPPADRLIGHNVLQYIPVGLLPPELRRKNVNQALKHFKTYTNKEFDVDYKQQEMESEQHHEEEYVKLNWQVQEPEISEYRPGKYNKPLVPNRKDVVPIVFLTEFEHRELQQNTENAPGKGKARSTNKLERIVSNNNNGSKCRKDNVSVYDTNIASNRHGSNKHINNRSIAMTNIPLGKECVLSETSENNKSNVAQQRRLCHSKCSKARDNNNNVVESSKLSSESKSSVASQEFLTRRRLIPNEGAYQKRMYARSSSHNAEENEKGKDNVA